MIWLIWYQYLKTLMTQKSNNVPISYIACITSYHAAKLMHSYLKVRTKENPNPDAKKMSAFWFCAHLHPKFCGSWAFPLVNFAVSTNPAHALSFNLHWRIWLKHWDCHFNCSEAIHLLGSLANNILWKQWAGEWFFRNHLRVSAFVQAAKVKAVKAATCSNQWVWASSVLVCD